MSKGNSEILYIYKISTLSSVPTSVSDWDYRETGKSTRQRVTVTVLWVRRCACVYGVPKRLLAISVLIEVSYTFRPSTPPRDLGPVTARSVPRPHVPSPVFIGRLGKRRLLVVTSPSCLFTALLCPAPRPERLACPTPRSTVFSFFSLVLVVVVKISQTCKCFKRN